MKAVQGNSGHAQVKMVADVYSNIIDEDRRINAELFEDNFYAKDNTPKLKNEATFLGLTFGGRCKCSALCLFNLKNHCCEIIVWFFGTSY